MFSKFLGKKNLFFEPVTQDYFLNNTRNGYTKFGLYTFLFDWNCLKIRKTIIITIEIFCEKRNASTPLGIEPRTFRLPVECSIIWATEVPHNFPHRIYLRLMWLRINRELFYDFSKSFQSIMSIIRRVYHYQWHRNSTISTLPTYDLELI